MGTEFLKIKESEDALEIIKKTKAKHATELEIIKAIQSGNRDNSWIDKELVARGCEVIEDFYK